ncbi:MAG: 5-formyltetrahydrofolate cyclo-ligase [Treponema sp.]|nr:5-formyltetrahydrofolate cyclo-ligase [Treponema sp.]
MKLLPLPASNTAAQASGAYVAMRKQWACYKTVLLFLSMKDEVDTEPLIKAAFEDKKAVFVPKIIANKLHFFRVADFNEFETGAFNIREPRGGIELTGLDFPAYIVTPGLAFDRNGRRLGRGKGYYDRFFAEIDGKGLVYLSIGLCSAEHIVDEVPITAFDKKMDAVIVVGSSVF